jgi:hypothetical protein
MKGVTKPLGKMAGKVGSKSIFGRAIIWISRSFKSLGKMFAGGGFLKPLLKSFKILGTKIPGINIFVGAIFGVVTAFQTMEEVFRNPDASGIDKFVGIVKGVLYGLLDFLDSTFLFGMGGLIKDFFFADLASDIDKGITKMFTDFYSSLNPMEWMALATPLGPLVLLNYLFPIEDMLSGLSGVLDSATDILWNTIPDWIEGAFESIGVVIGGLLKFIFKDVLWGAISWAFNSIMDLWDMGFSGIYDSLVSSVKGIFSSDGEGGGGIGTAVLGFVKGLATHILAAIWTPLRLVWKAIKGLVLGIVRGIAPEAANAMESAMVEAWIRGKRMIGKLKEFATREAEFAFAFAQYTAARLKKLAGNMSQAEFNKEASGYFSIKRELDRDKAKYDRKTQLKVDASLKELDIQRETAKKSREISKDAMKDQEKDAKKDQQRSIRNAIRNNKIFQSMAAKARASIIAAKKKAEGQEGATAVSIQKAVSAEQQRWTAKAREEGKPRSSGR